MRCTVWDWPQADDHRIKANIHEIARTFRTVIPNARPPHPGKEDFTPENRLRPATSRTTTDCIILTHEQFGKIPQSAEDAQWQILRQEMWDDIDENLASYEKR